MNWISSEFIKKEKKLFRKYHTSKPFPHLVSKNFFNKKKIERIRNALLKQQFERKESDLFSFAQTKEVAGMKDPVLQEFHQFFSSQEFLQFISKLTDTKLSKIDMSGFIYTDTDYLLPHDDRLEGRKIAYVLNLSKGFGQKDGGELSFFSTRNGKPLKEITSFAPSFNELFLFEVSSKSFHQVREVLSKKKRLTLAGWFHG